LGWILISSYSGTGHCRRDLWATGVLVFEVWLFDTRKAKMGWKYLESGVVFIFQSQNRRGIVVVRASFRGT
jgi:hypothetical protein